MGRERLERYRLSGPENQAAVAAGLAGGRWFRSAVPRARMKELMVRSDGPAIRDTAIWLGLLGLFAGLGIAFWGSWLALPFFLAYGVLYGNTDTLIVGRDPEIAAMRPARLARLLANFAGLVDVPLAFRLMLTHAAGRLTPDEADYVPEPERRKVYRTARIDLAVYAATIAAAIGFRSWLPVVLIGGPRLYGAFMLPVYGLTQHAGLGENVLDHRLNTRTVRMNAVNRFLYWNMNYHVEHHMFPLVPYHRLPALHEEIKHDCAPVYPSLWAAYREIIPAILRQLRDQDHFVHRELLPGAAPFNVPTPASDGRGRPLATAAAA